MASRAILDSPLPDPPQPSRPPPTASPPAPPPAPHAPESDPALPPAGAREPVLNPDAPVRLEVEMPRDLYDRLTSHDGAPRGRYDMATGRAEFVAEPGVSHEWRAWEVSKLFWLVEHLLSDEDPPPEFFIAGATRLVSDDGAFEPDTSLFVDPETATRALEVEEYLDTRKGHPVPDLVVEIDRSIDSRHKLAPYFRMGVREAWTWSRPDGVRIWIADPAEEHGFRAAEQSRVLPGVGRGDLDQLLAGRSPAAALRRSRIANRIARTLTACRESD